MFFFLKIKYLVGQTPADDNLHWNPRNTQICEALTTICLCY